MLAIEPQLIATREALERQLVAYLLWINKTAILDDD